MCNMAVFMLIKKWIINKIFNAKLLLFITIITIKILHFKYIKLENNVGVFVKIMSKVINTIIINIIRKCVELSGKIMK